VSYKIIKEYLMPDPDSGNLECFTIILLKEKSPMGVEPGFYGRRGAGIITEQCNSAETAEEALLEEVKKRAIGSSIKKAKEMEILNNMEHNLSLKGLERYIVPAKE
jgi:hypothetical protein